MKSSKSPRKKSGSKSASAAPAALSPEDAAKTAILDWAGPAFPLEVREEAAQVFGDYLRKGAGETIDYYTRPLQFGTGGLVAVHSAGRDRQSIWDAMGRKEVYGTSGDRILLWFDLIEGGDRSPMGSQLARTETPRFEVSAMGAFEQKPGCPADSLRAVAEDRLLRLCGGECYHPGDARKPIERIEVVRIRPQVNAGEYVGDLIEDPWLVLPCASGAESCTVQFADPDFASAGRDTLYYVRAHQSATPTINGAQLRCEYDEEGSAWQ